MDYDPPMSMRMNNSPTVEDLEKVEFWERLNTGLTISENPFQADRLQYPIATGEDHRYLRQIIKEGYFQTKPVIPQEITSQLSLGISRIFGLGIPSLFAFVYDEYWQLIDQFSQLLNPILGEKYKFIPDFWAWHIPKNDTAAGWGPHRDHQYNRSTLREDGRPTLITMWIPLTDATPLNACMYVLPTHLDPNYPENIDIQTVGHEQLQSIRALPARAGSVICWNSYVIHWGGRSSEWAPDPRISIGLYYQSQDTPLFDNLAMDIPCHVPFEFRLGVIGRAVLMYNKSRLSRSLKFSDALLGVCDKYASKLRPS